MNRRNFDFELPTETLRKMNREQYKATMHWLRYAAWTVHKSIDWDTFNKHLEDVLLFGGSSIRCEDLLI